MPTVCRHPDPTVAVEPYTGGVHASDENRGAHGDITEVHTCECGAIRRVNRNGRHTETGSWAQPQNGR